MRKIFNYALQAVLVSLMIVMVACTDEKDEANVENSSSTENTSNTSNPSGGTGTSGGSGTSSGSGTSGTSGARGNKTVTVKGGSTVNFVDLGLPSGTLWADRNVGASAPEAYGNYYAWGETSSKEDYCWSTYLDGGIVENTDCGTEKDIIWCKYGDKADIAGTSYDAATVNWGAGYKMPTKAQCEELNNSSYTTWTWCDGVNEKYDNTTVKGYKVTSKTNGNSIFLPAAGYRFDTESNYIAGVLGYYWSSSLYDPVVCVAWYVYFGSSSHDVEYYYGGRYRDDGFPVRPVSE